MGSLLWLSEDTRPDTSCAVPRVAKFMSNPGMGHWKAVKQILRYLKGTMDRKVVYNGKSNIDIIGYDKAECNVTPNLSPNDSRRQRKQDALRMLTGALTLTPDGLIPGMTSNSLLYLPRYSMSLYAPSSMNSPNTFPLLF